MKIPVLSVYLAIFRIPACLGLALLAMLYPAVGTRAGQDRNPLPGNGKVIVLDPGHGGHDRGAGKAGDGYEKETALLFAGLLAEKLKPAYTVHLTRSDDYEINLMHRPAVANHLEADLFLSIHTGASILHNHSGLLLAYYDGQLRRQHPDAIPPKVTAPAENRLPEWGKPSLRHLEKSRHLVDLLKENFRAYDPEIRVDILGMPLVVLEGADQPALLMEIGYLTNPADLRKLKDNDVLTEYADIIRDALDAYFSSQSDL